MDYIPDLLKRLRLLGRGDRRGGGIYLCRWGQSRSLDYFGDVWRRVHYDRLAVVGLLDRRSVRIRLCRWDRQVDRLVVFFIMPEER